MDLVISMCSARVGVAPGHGGLEKQGNSIPYGFCYEVISSTDSKRINSEFCLCWSQIFQDRYIGEKNTICGQFIGIRLHVETPPVATV